MIKMTEMSDKVSLKQQMGELDIKPVILINKFTVADEDVDAMVEAWKEDFANMQAYPTPDNVEVIK